MRRHATQYPARLQYFLYFSVCGSRLRYSPDCGFCRSSGKKSRIKGLMRDSFFGAAFCTLASIDLDHLFESKHAGSRLKLLRTKTQKHTSDLHTVFAYSVIRERVEKFIKRKSNILCHIQFDCTCNILDVRMSIILHYVQEIQFTVNGFFYTTFRFEIITPPHSKVHKVLVVMRAN